MAAPSREISHADDLYPSRTDSQYRFIARRDPLVYGRPDDGPLDAAALARYAETGYLHLPGLFRKNRIAPCRTKLERMRRDPQVRERPETFLEPDGEALRSVFAMHLDTTPLARLLSDPRLTAVARQILGSDVYIHQSRINYKPGFAGREFFWHADFETWHVEDGMPRMRALSCSICLEPNYDTNGPLMLVSGSHRRFLSCAGETPPEHYKRSLRKQELGVPGEKHLEALIGEGGVVRTTGPAGTVTFFECNLMHGSNSNITPYPRSNAFVVFNSVKNRLGAPYCGLDPRPEFVAHREHVEPLRD